MYDVFWNICLNSFSGLFKINWPQQWQILDYTIPIIQYEMQKCLSITKAAVWTYENPPSLAFSLFVPISSLKRWENLWAKPLSQQSSSICLRRASSRQPIIEIWHHSAWGRLYCPPQCLLQTPSGSPLVQYEAISPEACSLLTCFIYPKTKRP